MSRLRMQACNSRRCSGRSAVQSDSAVVRTRASVQPACVFRARPRIPHGRVDVRAHAQECVAVFRLDVEKQAQRWQEMGQREVRWFLAADAAALVDEAGLGALIESVVH